MTGKDNQKPHGLDVQQGNGCMCVLRDEGGSLLPMAAVGFLVLAAIVGGGVDLSRAHKAENRLQARRSPASTFCCL